MFGSRRQFLASIAASLAAAPFMTRRAWSAALGLRQDAAPLRLILWPALNGADHKYFWPNGEDFNVCTEPLKAHRSKITFLRGLNIEGSFNHFAIRSMFTGAPISDYLSPDPTVKSIDQVVAEHIARTQPTALRSMHLGSIPANTIEEFQLYGRSTFFFDPSPVHYYANPVTAYDKFFGSFAPKAQRADLESAILKLTQAELGDVLDRVESSGSERKKVQEHIAALQSLDEGDLPDDPPQCDQGTLASVEKLRPSLQGNEAEAYKHGYYSDIIDANIDLVVRAVTCGLTRVATVQNGSADGNVTVPVGSGMPHHMTSHGSQVDFSQCVRWYAEKFASLLTKLDVPDPLDPSSGRTVLDNSIVLWLSECMPVEHGALSVPCLYAGGAGAKLVQGQQLMLDNATNVALLKTICDRFGVAASDSGHFGDTKLSEILA